jgi:hypothetical protein
MAVVSPKPAMSSRMGRSWLCRTVYEPAGALRALRAASHGDARGSSTVPAG